MVREKVVYILCKWCNGVDQAARVCASSVSMKGNETGWNMDGTGALPDWVMDGWVEQNIMILELVMSKWFQS